MTNIKPFEGCKELQEVAKIKSSCCPSCHSTIRPDTSLIEIEYSGKKYLVCCHVRRAFLGITFKEELFNEQ